MVAGYLVTGVLPIAVGIIGLMAIGLQIPTYGVSGDQLSHQLGKSGWLVMVWVDCGTQGIGGQQRGLVTTGCQAIIIEGATL